MTKALAIAQIEALIARTPDSTSKYIDETLADIVALLDTPDNGSFDFADVVAMRLYRDAVSLPPPMAGDDDADAYNDMLAAHVAQWKHVARMSQAAASWLVVAGNARRAVDASAE